MHLVFKYNDGGKWKAGYRGNSGDCACRAIAIATGKPYREVYDELNLAAKCERRSKNSQDKSSARGGMYQTTVRRYLKALGWKWIPTMTIGSGCRIHLRADELPMGRIIVRVSKHVTCMIDGIINDTFNPDRQGLRCVYGYWTQEPKGKGNEQ